MREDTSAVMRAMFEEHPKVWNRARMRRAFVSEKTGATEVSARVHHESIECLGDAWLGAVITGRLWKQFPEASEKQLTRSRIELVDERILARIAREHELHTAILAGAGEIKQGQHLTDRSLAGHVEAILGAAWVVGGLEAVEKLVDHLWEGHWLEEIVTEREDNPVGGLQETVQGRTRGAVPSYTFESRGPDHQLEFRATVTLPWGAAYVGGWCAGKTSAKQDAARVAAEGERDGG